MMVSPGLSMPDFSASSTILREILSLTDPPALKNSHLATAMMTCVRESGEGGARTIFYLHSSHLSPADLEILLILTMGVFPILYNTFGIIEIGSLLKIFKIKKC